MARRYAVLRPHLDERQRRLLLGTEAAELGRGGIKTVAVATGVHPDTVARGMREIEGRPEPQRRVRAAGGGRKKLSETDPARSAAAVVGGPRHPWGSDVVAGVDDEVDQEPRRGVD